MVPVQFSGRFHTSRLSAAEGGEKEGFVSRVCQSPGSGAAPQPLCDVLCFKISKKCEEIVQKCDASLGTSLGHRVQGPYTMGPLDVPFKPFLIPVLSTGKGLLQMLK